MLARLRSFLRGLFRRSKVEAEMREEMAHHIELRAADLEREGVQPKEARRRAHLEFGHIEGHRENARASRGLRVFDQIRFSWLDVKLGVRMLWKHPGLTAVAVFSLAVGIPVSLAPLHLATAIEAPLPGPEGDRIRAIRLWNTATTNTGSVRYFEYAAWRDELEAFESLGAARSEFLNVAPEGRPAAPALGAAITASTFEILRTPPLLGRVFGPGDESPGAPEVVVVGHELWQSRLEGDPDVVGTTMRIAGVPHTVVGVMPEEFLFPLHQALWVPLTEEDVSSPGSGLGLMVFGRLAPGTNPETAQAEVAASGQRLANAFPESHGRMDAEVVPFALTMMGIPRGGLDAMPEFYFFQTLAILLLVVPCANVAMLIFARTATRARELAVRTALGAGRLRIVTQVLTESLVLAVVAAGAGLLSIDWLLGRVREYAEGQAGASLPYWLDLGLTWRTVLAGLAAAGLCAVLAGVVPALRVTGKKVQWNIQRARNPGSGARFGGMTTALIVGDVALAVVVIGFAGGLLERLTAADGERDLIGVQADEFLAVSLSLPTADAMSDGDGFDRRAFVQRLADIQTRLTERIAEEPEVRAVGVASALPRMDHTSTRFEVDGIEGAPGSSRYMRTARVDVDYFAELDQPILVGRGFLPADLGPNRGSVIVNETFVDRVLLGRNPIGRRIRVLARGTEPDGPWQEIVGVVGHLGVNILNPDVAVYLPGAPGEIHPLRLAVHVDGDPNALAPRVMELVGEVAPTAVLEVPSALDRVYQGDWYILLATSLGLGLFVGILVALAASGIYAILSFAVSERTRELGIRVALGASRGTIAMTIARRAVLQVGIGALLGMPLAARFFFSFREDAGEAVSAGSAALAAGLAGLAVMTVIALTACAGPALRAMRIEPTEALRVEM